LSVLRTLPLEKQILVELEQRVRKAEKMVAWQYEDRDVPLSWCESDAFYKEAISEYNRMILLRQRQIERIEKLEWRYQFE
jgi:hypothetical protein